MLRNCAVLLLTLIAVGATQAASPVSMQRHVADARIVDRLVTSGDRVERPHAKVFVEPGMLPLEAVTAFADRASAAVAGIREYLGDELQLRGGNNQREVEFYLSRDAGISHASRDEPRAFIVPSRIATETAPYVHEAVHAMAAWSGRAQWISEGFADHVAAQVVSQVDGYHFVPVEPRGIASAPEHLRSDYGQQVLPLIGAVGSREDVAANHSDLVAKIRRERRTFAAAFYTLSWSFVDYLVAQVGISGVRAIAEADGKDEAVIQATGRSLRDWKSAWLQQFD